MKRAVTLIIITIMMLTLGYECHSQSDKLRIYLNNGKIDTLIMSNIRVARILESPTLVYPVNNSLKIPIDDTLRWNIFSGATNYYIDIDTDSLFSHAVTHETVDTLFALDASLDYNPKYFWRVRAQFSSKLSSWSEVWNFTTKLEDIVLRVPDNNATSRPLNDTLRWNACSGANKYSVQVSTDSIFSSFAVNDLISHPTVSYVLKLRNNTKYYWRVKGLTNNGNESNWSEVWNFKTKLASPVLITPEDNAIAREFSDSLTWQAVEEANGYKVQISLQSDFSTFIKDTIVPNREFYIYFDLNVNTKYYWRVSASNSDGNFSDWSDTRSFKTKLSSPVLITPEDNAVAREFSDSLTWQAVEGATGYQVQISLQSDFLNFIKDTIARNQEFYIYFGLNAKTTYYWRVSALSIDGNFSDWSDTRMFSTKKSNPILTSPANNSISVPIDGSLSWDSLIDAVTYNVQLAEDSVFSTKLLDTVLNGIEVEYPNLSYNTKYFWRVMSIGSQDSSDWSEVWNFTTMLETDVEEIEQSNYQLLDCKPNPFIDETEISFILSKPGKVKLSISEITGRELYILTENYYDVGTHTVKFKAGDKNLVNGTYFYSLSVNGFAQAKQMVLIK
ncbi:MAG: hypothetical protein V1779_10030 [bacterium]